MGTSSSSGKPYRILLAGDFGGDLERRRIDKRLWEFGVETTSIELCNPDERHEIVRLQKAVDNSDLLVLDAGSSSYQEFSLAFGEAVRISNPVVIHFIEADPTDINPQLDIPGYQIAERVSFGSDDLLRKISKLLPPL